MDFAYDSVCNGSEVCIQVYKAEKTGADQHRVKLYEQASTTLLQVICFPCICNVLQATWKKYATIMIIIN